MLNFFFIFCKQGFKIEATIDDERTLPDGIILEVGAWFEIYNFKLTRSSGFIRPTKSRYQIKLCELSVFSKIEPLNESYFLCLTNFKSIIQGLSHSMFCIGM